MRHLLTGCINVRGNHLWLFLNCQLSLLPPSTHLPNTTAHFPHTSSLCASYLFILFSASIPSPLAQVSTPLLSHRLMIRALLCLSLFFSLVPPPSLLLLFPVLSFQSVCQMLLNQHGTFRNSKKRVKTKGEQKGGNIRLLTSWPRHKRVRHKLTEGGDFDEDSMEVRWYHLGEQGLLVSAPQVGQGLQT